MIAIILGIIFIFSCWKWGDLKNWKLYYPTILYFILGDLIYNVVTYNYPLWIYTGWFWNHTIADLFIAAIIFTCTTIIYLAQYPKKFKFQVLYIFFWIGLYSLIEYVSQLFHWISYDNGWNLWYSILFDCIIFPLIKLHFHVPLLAWMLSIVLLFIVLYMFKFPIDSMR